MDFGLLNKVALVTGAGSQKGFGKGIALTLAKEGCNVIAADIDLAGAQQTAAEIQALGRQALAVKVNITKTAEVNAMVKEALAKFGRIDILVNNAGGLAGPKLFAEKTEEEYLWDINLNLIGPINCTKAVVSGMIANKYGKIINIASIGAKKGTAHAAPYNAAKAGVEQADKLITGVVNENGHAVGGADGDRELPLVGRKGIRVRTKAAIGGLALGNDHGVFMDLLAPKNLWDVHACLRF